MAQKYTILPTTHKKHQGYDSAELGGISGDDGDTSSSNSDDEEDQNEQQLESLIVSNSKGASGRRSYKPKRFLSRVLRNSRTPSATRRRVSFQSLQALELL
ncbi:hypothetical protein QAD02_015243 [Eretmocerus hayati]|uniref:Uncharacterized protein n=1 Tax=Eretmocerus hayati TaxID=131215 RepID=A0ACC2P8X8_9HYME|nr:hypothetical protein QAD02_015243 [Eretmocerus hayati]